MGSPHGFPQFVQIQGFKKKSKHTSQWFSLTIALLDPEAFVCSFHGRSAWQHWTGASHGSQQDTTDVYPKWRVLAAPRMMLPKLNSGQPRQWGFSVFLTVLVWREDVAASASEVPQAYHVSHPLQRPVQTLAKDMRVSHAISWWELSQNELYRWVLPLNWWQWDAMGCMGMAPWNIMKYHEFMNH